MTEAEVLIEGMDGRRLSLGGGRRVGHHEEMWAFDATMAGPGFSATSTVTELGAALSEFFAHTTAPLRDWEEIRYVSLEGDLTLTARHDRKGLVTLEVALASPAPPKWETTAELTIGAGADAERVARDVARFVADARAGQRI